MREYQKNSRQVHYIVPISGATSVQPRPDMSIVNSYSPVYQQLQQQQQPCCFTGAHLENCTINVYQAPSQNTLYSTIVSEIFAVIEFHGFTLR